MLGGFCFKVPHVARNLSGNVGGWVLVDPPPSMKRIFVEIKPLKVSCITKTKLTCHQHLISARFVSTFDLRFEPTAMSLPVLFGFIYRNKVSLIVTNEDVFLKVKIYITLESEMQINTQLRNTLTKYNKSDISTKKISFVA